VVCITGQVSSSLIGSDAFQETDITGVTLPITKHNYLVTEAEEIAPALREAFYIARSGRRGRCCGHHKDAQQAACLFDWDAAEPKRRATGPITGRARATSATRWTSSTAHRARSCWSGTAWCSAPRGPAEGVRRAHRIPVAMTLLGIGRSRARTR